MPQIFTQSIETQVGHPQRWNPTWVNAQSAIWLEHKCHLRLTSILPRLPRMIASMMRVMTWVEHIVPQKYVSNIFDYEYASTRCSCFCYRSMQKYRSGGKRGSGVRTGEDRGLGKPLTLDVTFALVTTDSGRTTSRQTRFTLLICLGGDSECGRVINHTKDEKPRPEDAYVKKQLRACIQKDLIYFLHF